MAADALRLRAYEPADAEAVIAVHEAAFRASEMEFIEGAAVDEELQSVTQSYLAGGDTFLVGTVDDAVVATGGYRDRPERGGSTRVAEVGHVRVHPEHQQQGYARAIMDKIESLATEEGTDRLVLETHEDLVAAQALYESLGYDVDHTEAHPVTGDEMIHYAKDL